ncbi:MAG: hypothetical protein WD045_05295 [Pirellulaceae bacterium]
MSNPFYVALLVLGVVFVLSATQYVLMTIRLLEDPAGTSLAEGGGLLALFEQHGLTILAVELGLLSILTVGAITTDDYWQRRANRRGEKRPPAPKPEGDSSAETDSVSPNP